MNGLTFEMGGFQDPDGTINLGIKAGTDFEMNVSYKDPILAKLIVGNLPFILQDMMNQAIEQSFDYDMDEELKKILEEGTK